MWPTATQPAISRTMLVSLEWVTYVHQDVDIHKVLHCYWCVSHTVFIHTQMDVSDWTLVSHILASTAGHIQTNAMYALRLLHILMFQCAWLTQSANAERAYELTIMSSYKYTFSLNSWIKMVSGKLLSFFHIELIKKFRMLFMVCMNGVQSWGFWVWSFLHKQWSCPKSYEWTPNLCITWNLKKQTNKQTESTDNIFGNMFLVCTSSIDV